MAEALADPAKRSRAQPLDTVQFLGVTTLKIRRYVSVLGDVRAPGTYRTSGDIHLSDAIHLAGGLAARCADRDAQVFRYMPDSTLKIFNVKLSGALDGNPADNIVVDIARPRSGSQKRRGGRSCHGLREGRSGAAGAISADGGYDEFPI